MRIAVIGAGGIGGFLGARLAAAGEDVAFVARGAHLAAIRAGGLTVRSALGDLRLERVVATDDPATLPRVDLALFAVKGPQTEAAAEITAPLVARGAAVLSVQNGVDGLDRLIARFGADRVLAGVTYVPAVIEAPGVIRHTGRVTRTVFGEAAGGPSARADDLAARGARAGLDFVAVGDALAAVWEKFAILAPFAAISCLTRLPLGRWIAEPETRALYAQGMAEVAAVAAARGVALPPDVVERSLRFAETVADPGTRASMLEDLERGRPLELEQLVGAIPRLGRALGVPTPVLAALHAALKPHERGQVA